MSLILHGLPPLHWALAGVGVAGITLALLFLANRRLGISTGFEDICSLALTAPYFKRSAVISGREWRLPLLVGLVLGGILSASFGGGWEPTWALGIFALAALAGALVGAGCLGSLYPRLQHFFALPPLKIGAGEG